VIGREDAICYGDVARTRLWLLLAGFIIKMRGPLGARGYACCKGGNTGDNGVKWCSSSCSSRKPTVDEVGNPTSVNAR
jgi:hypothetical protein